MSDTKQLPKRHEVEEAKTWDLTTIYESDEAWEQDFEAIDDLKDKFVNFQGTLGDGADNFLAAFETLLDLNRKLSKLFVYSHLKSDQDTENSTYQTLNDRARLKYAEVAEARSWFTPELLSLSQETIDQYFIEAEGLQPYKHEIETILADRDHVLSAEKEALLAGASDILSSGSQTFSMLNNADIEFPTVTNEEGEKVQLSHGLYGELIQSTDRSVRQEAFKKMYEVYKGLNNTFASTLQSDVKKNNYLARVHHYDSARHQALSNNHIPESVHDTLLEVVNENLPLLHRYMALRKELLGLDELHMYDLYPPITGDDSLEYSFEEAKEATYKGLSVLGDEYKAILDKAFNERWIDVVENKGKRSGAYSSGIYDTNPFILLNWHDSLNHLYTLVHELGHSAHSYFTRNNQPYVYGDYSIFLAEIASTTNENLLTDYLLKKADSPEEKALILSQYLDGFKGTVFRQTQFAEFEHKIHTAAQEKQPLTADFLNKTYAEINDKFYGDVVVNDEEIQYEWSRIPHFYMGYYVYQYSTGFCAATALADKILNEEEGALDAYLGYLKSGSSDYPIEVMKKAGLDMTNKDYLQRAMDVFEQRLNQLEEVVKEIK